jgi:hypothetical protein
MIYLVTPELKTSRWKRLLRFFRIIKKREQFQLHLLYDYFAVGTLLGQEGGGDILIIGKNESV